MAERKLVLVNPTQSNPFPGFPPLGLGYVAALTPDHWDVEVVDENFEAAAFRPCDLVGITGFTAMAPRAYEVAQMFRERDVPVVMGGIHASMMPDEAARFVDAVVVGEAESVWADVIADFEAGRLKPRYTGTHTDLRGLVHPRRDLFDERYVCDTIQTGRGCPNDCAFCSVSQFNGFSYRRRPLEEVLDELETLRRKYLFVVDDNVVGLGNTGRQWAIAFARGMVERGLRFVWYSHAALDVADDERVLEALAEAGCRLLFLGMEAEDRDVLQSMNKKVNLKRSYDDVIRAIHRHHIGIHGSFIFGTDEDTLESLERRLAYMMEKSIDVLQFCAHTPYPGTRLFEQMLGDGRILHTDFPADWERYDLTEILVEPRNVAKDDYDALMRRTGATVYGWKNVARRFFRSWRDTGRLKTAIWCLFTNLIYRVPQGGLGPPRGKYWYLSRKIWPLIRAFQRIERFF